MNELEITKSIYSLDLSNTQRYQELQNLIDQNEKSNKAQFAHFSDVDMIYWYIYENKHIDRRKDTNERTRYEYERELKQFIQNLLEYADEINFDVQSTPTDSLLKVIEPRHLRRYQDWLVTDSPHVKIKGAYSPATIARKTTILKSFFSFLYKNGYSSYNASKGLRIASVRSDDRPNRDLGSIETTRILDTLKAVDLRYYTIVLTLVTTGLRNEELCKLTLGSIQEDWINGGYFLRVVGKGNKQRDIPLKNSVLEKIRYYREEYKLTPLDSEFKDEPIFVTRNKKAFTPTYLARVLKKVINDNLKLESGVKITPHSFRHAFAIISHMNGVNIYDIMRSLGHEKIETTMIYLERVQARSSNAINSWKNNVLGEHL